MSYPNNPQWQQPLPGAQHWSGSPQAYASAPTNTNGTAIAALVFSLLFAPAGIVLGYMARSQIKRTGEGGRGLATAALIIGWVQFAVVILPLLLVGLWLVAYRVTHDVTGGLGSAQNDYAAATVLLAVGLIPLSWEYFSSSRSVGRSTGAKRAPTSSSSKPSLCPGGEIQRRHHR